MSKNRKRLFVFFVILLLFVAAGFLLRDSFYPKNSPPPSVCWDGKVFYFFQGSAVNFEGDVLGRISSVTAGRGDASVHGEARNFQALPEVGERITNAEIGFWRGKYYICFTADWYPLTEAEAETIN